MSDKSKWEPDCRDICKSRQHGAWCTAAVIRGNDSEIQAALPATCRNFVNVWDYGGRNVLHVAASCGRRKIVSWLARLRGARTNVKDLESGYTALHRSVFYGQINCAVELLKLGCNPNSLDQEGLTAFELALLDRPLIVDLNPSNPCELYVWGTNSNYNLGIGHDQTRALPDVLEFFRKNNIVIKQASMDKFHSLFLDSNGKVYACGHGNGGRLGLNSNQPQLEPRQVSVHHDSSVVMVAAAANHSAFLLENGIVLSCGSNQHGQLGHPLVPEIDAPKPLPWFKLQKGGFDTTRGTILLAVGHFHSVFCSRDGVFTFGLNGGQLGHAKLDKEKILWTPRKVTALDLGSDGHIVGLAASEGSTVITVKRNSTGTCDVFVLHEYQCRKVASKLAGDLKISVVGGNLDSKGAENLGLIEKIGSELMICILTTGDRLLLWRGAHNNLKRVILSAPQQLTVADAVLTKAGLGIVTKCGRVFTGLISDEPVTKTAGFDPKFKSSYKRVMGGKLGSVDDRINQYPPEVVKLNRVPGIWRAVSLAADPKGKNYATLQANPKDALYDLPVTPDSTTVEDWRNFFDDILSLGQISDVILRVINGECYHANWFVLRSRCFFFNKLHAPPDPNIVPLKLETKQTDPVVSMFGYSSPFEDADFQDFGFREDAIGIPTVDTEIFAGIHPFVIKQFLIYVYTGTCDLMLEQECPFIIPADGYAEKFIIFPKAPVNKSKKKKNKAKDRTKRIEADDEETMKMSLPIVNPLAMMNEVAEKLNWKSLKTTLSHLDFQVSSDSFPSGRIVKKSDFRNPSPVSFSCESYPELKDIIIVAEGGEELSGHQCVLAARLQYFRSMLGFSGGSWSESGMRKVKIPLPIDLLKIVVDFLYTDSVPDVLLTAQDPTIAANILVVSDQFLITRLKGMCEEAMVSLLSLKNVAEFLDFAEKFGAAQLKNSCFQFVCLNLSAVLESRVLDSVTDLVIMDQLTTYYQNFVLERGRRRITPSSDGPTAEELQAFASANETTLDDLLAQCDLGIECERGFELLKVRSPTKTVKKKPTRIRKSSQSQAPSSEPEKSEALQSPRVRDEPSSTPPFEKIQERKLTPIGRRLPAPVTPQKLAALDSKSPSVSTPKTFKLLPRVESSVDEENFPSLNGTVHEVHTRETVRAVPASGAKSEPLPIRVKTKMSQKQRKKLSEKCEEDEIVPVASPPKPANAWFSPLSGIAKSPTASSPIEISRKTSALSLNESSSPGEALARSPEGWGNDSSFSKILEEEEVRKKNLEKIKAKPLSVIQKEDQAIEELLLYYNAEGNAEERITVLRSGPSDFATPIWHKKSSTA
ncbi:unnamed protein product [Notodromas monacha]|uniref:BTB domain-containing protein n=1 Tax=Notodromas monacha TaxID=399045 RepID=A0A7R9BCE5_9CRUS|nr:unnamed protein product [Notodromas monacha]CAG0912732.1 unnamed protein product [Notodromas monacha]